jgi:hypothetical protein
MSSNKHSNAKHWCPLCKTFIQNDFKSIKMHEEGFRHLNVVKRKLSQAAYKKDLANERKEYRTVPAPIEEEVEEQERKIISLREDEMLGQYLLKGNSIYLQGDLHEDLLLLPTSSVQVSLVDEEGEPGEWITCEILDLDLSKKAYVCKFQQGGDAEPTIVHVLPQDLRIIGPHVPSESTSATQWLTVERGNEEEKEEAPLSAMMAVNSDNEDVPKAEYYKGVIIDDDNQGKISNELKDETTTIATSFNKSSTTISSAQPPVMFRKRARPANKN